jgi:hypothetical protein
MLWPDHLPSLEDVIQFIRQKAANAGTQPSGSDRDFIAFLQSHGRDWAEALVLLHDFTSTLGKVRRVLANIPIYMIWV